MMRRGEKGGKVVFFFWFGLVEERKENEDLSCLLRYFDVVIAVIRSELLETKWYIMLIMVVNY